MDQLIENTLSAALNPRSFLSLQEQLHERLRDAILKGVLSAGTRIPATRQLAAHLSVSRNTVLAAYDQLIAEGYLDTRRGAGTFVTADLPDNFISAQTQNPVSQCTSPSSQSIDNFENLRSDYGLLSGAPALDQFPRDLWARLISRAWRSADKSIFQHDDLAGYGPLRTAIAKYLQASRNIVATADQILIFSGLQQGFKLAADCLLAKDAAVILENPGYGGMFRAAETLTQRVLFTSIDKSGARVPDTKGRNMLVISPSRQFPLSITMPLARRLELLDWARATDSLILEDDYDSEFRYAGRPLNSLQGIDGGERVIYGGSFSKTVFPALRLGYLVLPSPFVGPVLKHRAAVDSYPSIMPQIALSHFMEGGHFARHVRKLRKTHAERQQIFLASFKKNLEPFLTLEAPDAGLHMIARPKAVLKHLPDTELAAIGRVANIGVFPLSSSYQPNTKSAKNQQGLLFGFANLEDNLIDPALRHFAELLARPSTVAIPRSKIEKETDF